MAVLILKEGEVESELEWNGSSFVLLNNFELLGVEVEVGEVPFHDEGVADDRVCIVCGLKWNTLLTLHSISIHQISKS